MALSIQSNAASTTIRNQLNRTNDSLGVALERLGTGFRINSAKDDAAGLQIASRLSAQLVGQETAINNANNANSMLKTAEGAFDEMTNIALRMKELATQAANGTNSSSEYKAFNAEYGALKEELANIVNNTSFGSGTNLLASGGAGKFDASITFQIGASSAETLAVDISTELGAVHTSIGSGLADLEWNASSTQSQTDARTEIDSLNTFLDNVGAARSKLGASMNRLDHTINNLSNMAENTGAAKNQLMDADFAKETSNMTKQQLLLNSGISVLSTSSTTTQMVSQLLR